MSRLWLLVPAVAFVALLGFAVADQGSIPAVGDEAPGFEAPLLQGEGKLALGDLRGTPVVINFWASWCAPCKDEAPMLSAAAEEYSGRVEFVGIDIRDARSEALAFVEEFDLDYPHVRDEHLEIYEDYGLTGQPETFFIDHEGIVVEHVNGPLTQDSLYQLLDVLVARSG